MRQEDTTLYADLTLRYMYKGDTPGHPFRGNQYGSGGGGGDSGGDSFGHKTTRAQAEHASQSARTASDRANARGNLSNKKRAALHDKAGALHRAAAEMHVAAARGMSYIDQEYHHQIAAGHQSRADSHFQAALTYRGGAK